MHHSLKNKKEFTYGEQLDTSFFLSPHNYIPAIKEFDQHLMQQLAIKSFTEYAFENNVRVDICLDKNIENIYRQLITLLRPYELNGRQKVRIGGESDGGYIMYEPLSHENIALSIGVGNRAPWDIEMARKGIKVLQFDNTIISPPDKHNNLFFYPFNVCSSPGHDDTEITLFEIIDRYKLNDKYNIILQIDVEGAEWEIFDNSDTQLMNHFSQIIVEFHNLLDFKKLAYYQSVIRKINRTHRAIHFHYNNHHQFMAFNDFIVSPIVEISFVRLDMNEFSPSHKIYPTNLDYTNKKHLPDFFIGDFNVITSK